MVQVGEHAADELGVLNVVEADAGAEEQVVLKPVGRSAAPVVVVPLREHADVDGRSEHGIETVLGAEHEGGEVLIPPENVERASAMNGLQLEQPRACDQLRIQAELTNLNVVRRQYGGALIAEGQPRVWLPAGAVKSAQAEFERPEAAAVADGGVPVPLAGTALIGGVVVIQDHRQPQAAAPARIGEPPMVGHAEQLQRPPIARPGEVGHGLSEPHFLVRMLNEVDLIDDVDQVLRFGDAPKDAISAQAQFPLVVPNVAEQQQIGFAHVEVGTLGVPGIVAKERNEGEDPSSRVFQVQLRLRYETAGMGALAGVCGGLGVPPALDAQTACELAVGDPRRGCGILFVGGRIRGNLTRWRRWCHRCLFRRRRTSPKGLHFLGLRRLVGLGVRHLLRILGLGRYGRGVRPVPSVANARALGPLHPGARCRLIARHRRYDSIDRPCPGLNLNHPSGQGQLIGQPRLPPLRVVKVAEAAEHRGVRQALAGKDKRERRGTEAGAAAGHYRIRLRPVWVKSPSSRSVRNW